VEVKANLAFQLNMEANIAALQVNVEANYPAILLPAGVGV
jgi:hypothetical protein